ncbi:MAG: carbohydrate ABC transporter permease [Atribacterota bacterium]
MKSGRKFGFASSSTPPVVLVLLLLYALFPLFVAVNTSLKSRADLFADPLGLPRELYVSNYAKAFQTGNFKQAFFNSAILAAGTVFGLLLTAIPAAYALAKIHFKGSSFLVGYYFFCTTIPQQLFIIPLYFTFSRFGLTNSLFGLVLIYIATFSPFSILLMRSYFVGIPHELVEAALIDGASLFGAFWRVVFPVARPGVITTVVVVAMWSWNNFLLPLTFLNQEGMMPVTVRLGMLMGKWSAAWELIMASALMGALPIVVLFAFLHRKFIAGLAGTGLKG